MVPAQNSTPQQPHVRGIATAPEEGAAAKRPFLVTPAASATPPSPVVSQPVKETAPDNSPAAGGSRETALSKKVLDALSEDPDPAKSLADIRKLLVGPTRRLQEARMEEIISIMEESDRGTQKSLTALEARCLDLARKCEKLSAASELTDQKARQQSEFFSAELAKSSTAQQDSMSEMFLVIDAKLEKMASLVNERIDQLTAKTSVDNQTLVSDFANRMRELSASTNANIDRMVDNFEARLTRAEAQSDNEHRRHVEAFAHGFNDIADRLLMIRGVQAS